MVLLLRYFGFLLTKPVFGAIISKNHGKGGSFMLNMRVSICVFNMGSLALDLFA